MNTIAQQWKTGVSGLLLLIVLAAPVSARAQMAVVEVGPNTIQTTLSTIADQWQVLKDSVLNPLAHAAAKAAIQSIMRSTINWANSGFNGSPAYVTNLENDLRRLADVEADRFLDQYVGSGNIDSPFRDRVANTVRGAFRRNTAEDAFFQNSRYTLQSYAKNDQAFVRGEFAQGGLRAWVEAWRNDQNNIFGAIRSVEGALNGRLSVAISNRQVELSWSQGIFSWCSEPESVETGSTATGQTATPLTQAPAGGSAKCQTQTPGTFLHARIQDSLGADIASLVAADELDEVVSALLSGLANKILGGSGFAGLSQPDSSGRSPLDQAGQQVATSTASRTIGIISGQLDELNAFKSNWTTIKTAAEGALASCENSSRTGAAEAEELARDTLEEAEAALAKADASIERLSEIRTQLSANGATPAQMRAGFEAYEELMASSTMPSGSEVARAATQSQNSESIQPPTLVYRLNEAARSCGRIL